MKSRIVSPPHAILFIFDPTNKGVVIPPYVDDKLIVTNDSCVSVGTQAAVDGDTEVSLDCTGTGLPPDLHCAFNGVVAAPGGKLAIETSEAEKVFEVKVPEGEVAFSIWVDDPRSPARVVVKIPAEVHAEIVV